MTKIGTMLLVVLAAALALTVAAPASAHNRAHIILPNGDCVLIGSLKSVFPGPDKTTELDLVPSTPQDEIGTSFVARMALLGQGNPPLLLGNCP